VKAFEMDKGGHFYPGGFSCDDGLHRVSLIQTI
jgi:hypothetical protein